MEPATKSTSIINLYYLHSKLNTYIYSEMLTWRQIYDCLPGNRENHKKLLGLVVNE